MLEKCERGQWNVNDLDWSGTPRPMSRDDEIAIVQYFTDMAGIERLAGALFAEQEKKVDDPTLKKIFKTFVRDEARHARAAEMLARYYDVHHYQSYEQSESLRAFTPHFVDAVKHLSPDIANAYITGGELILDVALLRSIDDHVHDDMSASAMELINRDESRHIAIDFHMIEYYASDAWAAKRRASPPRALRERARAWWAFVNVIYRAAPFFRDVFFEPMSVVDPSGKRLREAFKRIQLVGKKPDVQRHPFTRFMQTLQDVYNDHAVVRLLFGGVLTRVIGVPGNLVERLYTEEESRRALHMSFDELAAEALAVKHAT